MAPILKFLCAINLLPIRRSHPLANRANTSDCVGQVDNLTLWVPLENKVISATPTGEVSELEMMSPASFVDYPIRCAQQVSFFWLWATLITFLQLDSHHVSSNGTMGPRGAREGVLLSIAHSFTVLFTSLAWSIHGHPNWTFELTWGTSRLRPA